MHAAARARRPACRRLACHADFIHPICVSCAGAVLPHTTSLSAMHVRRRMPAVVMPGCMGRVLQDIRAGRDVLWAARHDPSQGAFRRHATRRRSRCARLAVTVTRTTASIVSKSLRPTRGPGRRRLLAWYLGLASNTALPAPAPASVHLSASVSVRAATSWRGLRVECLRQGPVNEVFARK